MASSAYAAGHFGGSQEPLVLPLPIPIEIPNEQSSETTISAAIGGAVGSDGVFRLDGDSMLEIDGSQGIGASAFADLLDIDVEDFQTTKGRLVLDRHGALLEASTNFGIHPSIDLGAGAKVTVSIDADSLADSYIEAAGVMKFSGVSLDGESAIRLDRDGLRAHGVLDTAIGGVALDGYVGPAGIDLHGRAELSFPTGAVSQFASNADASLQAAIDEVNRIDDEIAQISDEIRSDRRQRSSDFQAAKNAVDDAQAEVDKLNGQIDDNNRRINVLKGYIDDVCAGKSGLDLTGCQIANAGKIAGWQAEITALQVANGGLFTARTVATGTLSAARAVLEGIEATLDAIPVETDPRIIALGASRDTALAVLETTRALAKAVADGGTLSGHVDIQLGTAGLGGEAVIEWCDDDGCDALAGAKLRFIPDFEACIIVPGIPDICAKF